MAFLRPRRPLDPPVSLHVGADCVRMVQLRPAAARGGAAAGAAAPGPRRLPLLAAALCLPLPPEVAADPVRRIGAAAGLIERVLRRGPFSGRRVVTALPPEFVHVRTFRLDPVPPAADARPTQERIDSEAARNARDAAGASADEPVRLQNVLAGEIRQGASVRHEVLSFAARPADVRAYLEPLAAAGARVESLCVDTFSIFRAAADTDAHSPTTEPACRCVVHVAAYQTQIIIGRGDRVEVVRTLDLGTASMELATSRKLGVTTEEARELRSRPAPTPSPARAGAADPLGSALFDAARPTLDAIAREAALCLRYHAVGFRSRPPQHIRLVGTGAADTRLRAVLASCLAVPVDASGVFHSVDASTVNGIDLADGGWATAIGTALRGVATTDSPSLADTTIDPVPPAAARESALAGPRQEAANV